MAWYVIFRGRKPGVYDSWGICNDQVSSFCGASFLSYHTRGQAEAAYSAFVYHEKQKLRPQVLHVSSGKQVLEIWTLEKHCLKCAAHCDNSAVHCVMLHASEILSVLLCSKLLKLVLCCICVH
jgi:viroplasmin and RNaseH domain-containing protein